MSSALLIFFVLYSPAILSVASLLCLIRVKQITGDNILTLQPFGIFGISFPVSSRTIIIVLILLAAFGFLALYAFYDFTIFFPKHLQMEVFFDDGGLQRVITNTFSTEELKDLGVTEVGSSHQREYFNRLDQEAKIALGSQHFFALTDGNVHSVGDTSFVVTKIDGWQRYYIQESKGELNHILDAPHIPQKQFYTLFEKMTTSNDYINTSLWDLVVHRRVILRPRFKQLLAENRTSKGVVFSVSLIGVTRLTVFPWPAYSPTVYCADLPPYGLVPFAYAIYK